MKLQRLILLLIVAALSLMLGGCGLRNAVAGNGAKPPTQLFIENKGSDTMVNLALAWAERYQELHPEFRISVTGGGSGTGIAALINGTVDVANASRQIKPEEIEAARSNGTDPIEFVVARDAIAIVINRENRVDQLTLEQLSEIFSGNIVNWLEVGGADQPIVRLSRETNSGTHVYFLEEVLRLGQKDDTTLFSRNTLLLPSSEGITAEVRDNPYAIGYDGLGYVTEEVKVVAVAPRREGPFIYPSAETVNQNVYPIARDLYMYTSGQPEGAIKDYIDWIFSDEAQAIVTELGFVPVN